MTLFGSIDYKNIKYTGEAIPELGIAAGDALSSVLDKLITAVKGTGVGSVPTGNQISSTVSTAALGGASLAVSNILERSFTYSVTQEGDGASVTYDMSQVKDSLPAGYEALSGTATFIDNTKKRTQSRGTSGVVSVKNFPVKADFIIGVRTPAGDVEMRKGAVIPTNAEISEKAIFDVRDFTSSTTTGDGTVDDNLATLVAEVSEIRKKVETLTSLNLPVELEVLKQKTSS